MSYELPLIFGKRQKSKQSTGACVFLGRHAIRVELRLCFCLVLIDSYLISIVKDKKDKATNLVPRVLSFPFPGAGERETLENAGHVSPIIWEMTKDNIEGGAGKSGVMVKDNISVLCDSKKHREVILPAKTQNVEYSDAKKGLCSSWSRKHELL